MMSTQNNNSGSNRLRDSFRSINSSFSQQSILLNNSMTQSTLDFAKQKGTQPLDLSKFPDKPMQFIKIDDQGKCIINHQTFDLLAKINTKIAIICVSGPYRTGKSFLLNRLLGKSGPDCLGFDIGSTVQSCTKGLWIWGRPIKVSDDLHAILIDTEGLNSCERDQQVDIKIFTLALLLSSYFMYNCMNAIDENALESLSLVVNLSKHIHVNSKPSTMTEDQSLFAKYFPSFMWVIRDFALQLVDDDENEINAKQYLENALRPVELQRDHPDDQDVVRRKNEIRNVMKTFFNDRDCHVLVRPIADEKKLRDVNSLPYESLRSNFRYQIEDLVKKVFANIKPKVIEGQPLTGQMLCELADTYVQAMNSDAIPTITTAWERVIDGELRRVYEHACSELDSFMKDVISKQFPLEDLELKELLTQAKRRSLSILSSPTIQNSPPEKLTAMRVTFDEKFEEMCEVLNQNNYLASEKTCEDLWRTLHEKVREKVNQGEYGDIRELNEDWDLLRKYYTENSKGPAKYAVSHHIAHSKYQEDVDQVAHQIKQQAEQAAMEMQQKLLVAQGLCENAKTMLKEEKERVFEDQKLLREKHQRERMELDSKIDELRLELNKRDDQIRRLEFEVEKSVKLAKVHSLSQQNQQLLEGTGGPGVEMNAADMKQMMSLINSQIHQKEVENVKLRLTKEYEIKIKDIEKLHYERMQLTKQETKRAFDVTLENMKAIYDDEIKALKGAKRELEEKVNTLKREIVKREGDVQLLQERIRGQEKEKNLKLEHAQLLCKLSSALKGYAEVLEQKTNTSVSGSTSISKKRSDS